MKRKYVNRLPKGAEVKGYIAHVENGEIIVEVELKDRFQPKDGDFLKNKCGKVFIYNGLRGEYSQFGAYCGTTIEDVIKVYKGKGVCAWADKEGCSFATQEEKSAFLERLEKEFHKRWNAEKKCLEDIRWRAKKHEYYFYVNTNTICVCSTDDAGDVASELRYQNNNYFRTNEAAQKVADQIINIFKNAKAE